MNFDWYKVINRAEFLETGLVSRELELELEDRGSKTFLVTVGNYFSISFDEVMLSINMAEDNPFVFEDRAIYLDANDDVWVGFLIDED
jgi:hypothetical protein